MQILFLYRNTDVNDISLENLCEWSKSDEVSNQVCVMQLMWTMTD